MKFIILKKDKDSTIARNDSVFHVNNFFVVLTTVSSVANSFGIVSSLAKSIGISFPTGNVIETCFFGMFSLLLAALSFVSTMGLADAVPPIKNVCPLLFFVLVLITNYNIYFR